MNKVLQALNLKRADLCGKAVRQSDALELQKKFAPKLAPDWYLELITSYPLCGAGFELSEGEDLSGLGALLEWMSPAFTLEEALDTEPGRSVLRFGYLPFGTDLTGGGDPYFLDLSQERDDPPVVRIPHDYAVTQPYPLENIELVAEHLSTFLALSTIPKPLGPGPARA